MKQGPGSSISPGFDIADDVEIGRNCVLEGSGCIEAGVRIADNVCLNGRITLGAGTRVGHGVVMSAEIITGRNNFFHPYCVIGEGPMYPDKPNAIGPVVIGDDNVFREFASINGPALTEATRIGNHCYLMGYAHVSHDCVLGDHVKMAMHAALAGSVTVGDHSYIGMHAAIHQRVHIGPHTMIGMAGAILKHVPPYAVVHSGKFARINAIGLSRRGVSAEEIAAIETYYRTGTIKGHGHIADVLAGFARDRAGQEVYPFQPA